MLDQLYQALDPVAFSIGTFEVRWYSLAYIVGFLCVALTVWRLARLWQLELSADDLYIVIMSCVVGVIVGGRLGYVLFYGIDYYLSHPLEIFLLNQGGMSFHGGLVGAIVASYASCRYCKLNFTTVADMVVCGAPIGLFFGRIANFINGELWGKASDVAWAVSFESGGGVARHPSQLYEALLEGLVLFLVLYALSRKTPPLAQGTFIGVFLALYGIFRFLVEFVRLPDSQLGYLFGTDWFTMGQLLSLPLILTGTLFIVFSVRIHKPQQSYMT